MLQNDLDVEGEFLTEKQMVEDKGWSEYFSHQCTEAFGSPFNCPFGHYSFTPPRPCELLVRDFAQAQDQSYQGGCMGQPKGPYEARLLFWKMQHASILLVVHII